MNCLLLQPCADPGTLVCGLQGGGNVSRLNALIASCVLGATYSLNKRCRKQRLNLSKSLAQLILNSLMYSQPTFKVILKLEYIFP